MSVKASAVSRYLGAMGLNRSEWVASQQVRGWGHSTTGYKCQDEGDFNYRPAVRVSWVLGDGYRHTDAQEQSAMVLAKVRAMRDILQEKYDVQLEVPDSTFGGDPYLLVTGRKADAEE